MFLNARSTSDMEISLRKTLCLLAFVLIVAIILITRQFTNTALGYPDADRLLMDGVFIHDLLQDLPLTRIYDYTIRYYGQYPALSIGYRPPFFPFVEGLFNLVFGVNVWSSRLSLVLFAVVGVSAWFFLVRRVLDDASAFFSGLLLVSMPFFAKWGWYTMGELPLVSMTMLTAYLFHRYVETNSPKILFSMAVAFTATVWTKQSAFYLAFWFILYMLYSGVLLERIKDKKTWLAVVMVLAFLVPLALITVWLGEQNLAQSIGETTANGQSIWVQRWQKLPLTFKNITHYQVTFPLLLLTIIGIGSAIAFKEKKVVFFALLIVTTFLFFSYVIHKNERYTIFWLPAFTVFAALPVYQLRNHASKRNVFALILIGTVIYQINEVYDKEPNYATGYDQAAAYVLKTSKSQIVFVDAYNNGYFTYFMRALDENRSMYVLRADKLLTSSSILATKSFQVHAQTRKDIQNIFNKYGVELIVIESKDLSGIKIHQELREYLREGPFELVEKIAVSSTRPPLIGQQLLIFRYNDYKRAQGGMLKLHLPVVGQTIHVPINNNDDADIN